MCFIFKNISQIQASTKRKALQFKISESKKEVLSACVDGKKRGNGVGGWRRLGRKTNIAERKILVWKNIREWDIMETERENGSWANVMERDDYYKQNESRMASISWKPFLDRKQAAGHSEWCGNHINERSMVVCMWGIKYGMCIDLLFCPGCFKTD